MLELEMVVSQETIDRISATAAADDKYQLLIEHIQGGRPNYISQVPDANRLYRGFADELIVCGG